MPHALPLLFDTPAEELPPAAPRPRAPRPRRKPAPPAAFLLPIDPGPLPRKRHGCKAQPGSPEKISWLRRRAGGKKGLFRAYDYTGAVSDHEERCLAAARREREFDRTLSVRRRWLEAMAARRAVGAVAT